MENSIVISIVLANTHIVKPIDANSVCQSAQYDNEFWTNMSTVSQELHTTVADLTRAQVLEEVGFRLNEIHAAVSAFIAQEGNQYSGFDCMQICEDYQLLKCYIKDEYAHYADESIDLNRLKEIVFAPDFMEKRVEFITHMMMAQNPSKPADEVFA